jgi:hypothetical protein
MVATDNTNKKTESTIDEKQQDNELPTKHELERDMKPSIEWTKINKPSQTLTNTKEEQQHQDKPKQSIVKESLSKKAYTKAGIPFPYSIEEDRKETFERQVKGKWTRRVTSITWLRDLEENEFLDWNEVRTGYTDMKRKIEEPFNHVGQYDDPVPDERVEYDPDNEENRLVIGDKPKEINKAYHFKFTKTLLQELLDDCNPRTCEFIISQNGQRPYSVSKKEMEKYAGDFDTLFSLKSDPNFKIVQEDKKK